MSLVIDVPAPDHVTEVDHPDLEETVGTTDLNADALLATGRWRETRIRLIRPMDGVDERDSWADLETTEVV
jgi:hypothetical protein